MNSRIYGLRGGARAISTLLLPGAFFALGCLAHPQLAITEVMSSAAITFQQTNTMPKQSDWWELTNFATNAADQIDLAGYTFTDGRGSAAVLLVQAGDAPLIIQPGQSVLFVREKETTNYFQFTNWWGAVLDPQVPVRFYPSPGLSSIGDGVRLYDPANTPVDSVDFGRAVSGITFTSDANGDFGVLSTLGECGAGSAATADDLGSPGFSCGPVPLRFLEQPTNQSVAPGIPVVLSAQAAGLPRPHYQWFFNGQPLPESSSRTLVIPSVGQENDGVYEVEIRNYFGALRSPPALLTVNTNPSPPVILVPPVDRTFLAGMNVQFSVAACGYPPPGFQWFSNGVAMLGETSPSVCIPNCEVSMSGTVFCVQVSNALGSTNACATATVIPHPKLEVTEVMATPLSSLAHESWFEVTNFDTNEVNLLGWRFADNIGLATAFQVNQRLIIKPGESVVFVKRMQPHEFASWWGADNIPPRLQVCTFDGFGLSPDESLYFWPAGAVHQFLELFGTWSLELFPPEILPQGVSLWLNTTNHPFGWPSEIGVQGAFPGVETPDIGSPGYVAPPPLQLLSIQRTPSEVNLKWRAIPGRHYELQFKNSLLESSWWRAGSCVATNATGYAQDVTAQSQSRFYRVEKLP